MCDGKVPGNRNLDNVSPELRSNGYLFYPNKSVEVPLIKAGLLKSFGFGQAGAEILIVNPDYLLATVDSERYDNYVARRSAREKRAFRYQQGVLAGNHTLVQVKDAPPYTPEQETRVYLDPEVRAAFDPKRGTWTFGGDAPATRVKAQEPAAPTASIRSASVESLQETMQKAASTSGDTGVGVDVEPVATFADWASGDKEIFFARNFTKAEREYCVNQPDPAASYAGKWACKEAVIKALSNTHLASGNLWSGAGAGLLDIEVLASSSGAPAVTLHGHAAKVQMSLKVKQIKVSISHAGDVAIAQAIALL
jgi:phosphopantetheine--protein transferase-like protein